MTLILQFLRPAPPTPQFNDIWHIVYPSDAIIDPRFFVKSWSESNHVSNGKKFSRFEKKYLLS